MDKFPKISIIIPSFNQGRYIEQTLASIINQRYPNLELIVMDGGSNDNTIDIIKKYESDITFWVSEKDKGQSDAINKGLAKCTGEIFNWINSDDFLAPIALIYIAKAFSTEDIDIFAGNCHHFLEDPNNIQTANDRTVVKNKVEETILNSQINQPAMFYKTSIIKGFGGVNETLHYVMDYDIWMRYLLKFGQKKIYFSDALIAYFRLHIASKTTTSLDRFDDEKKLVYYSIASDLGAPGFLLNEYKIRFDIQKKLKDYEISSRIDRDFIIAGIFEGFPDFFYEKKDYPSLKKTIKILRSYNRFASNRRNILLQIKVYLLPGFVLNFLRKIKNL